MTISMVMSIHTKLMVAMLSAITDLALGSPRLSQNSVQIAEAKFNVQRISTEIMPLS